MPPTRGHDLKRVANFCPLFSLRMPPTRGHDLKLLFVGGCIGIFGMPPTRGHDLKLSLFCEYTSDKIDAPHTGARLETFALRR